MTDPQDHVPAMAMPKAVPYIRTYKPQNDDGVAAYPSHLVTIHSHELEEADTAEWSDRVDIGKHQGAACIRRRLAEVHGLDPRGGVLFWRIDRDAGGFGCWVIKDAKGTEASVLKDSPIPADEITLALAMAAKRWLA